MEATSILIGAENNNGVGLYTEVDDTLGTGAVTGTATDALALVNLGYTVSIQGNGTETTHIHTFSATGAAVVAHIGAVFSLFGTATTVTVDTSDLLREFFLNDHYDRPPLSAFVGCTAERQTETALTV